jgi:tetratricopeptide (TPR) repeat protein
MLLRAFANCSAMNEVKAFPRLSQAQADLDDGHPERAAAKVMQHLREHPNDARGTALLGSIALKSGALVQAEQFLRRAIALGARDLGVQRELAKTMYRQDRLADALAAYTHLEQQDADPELAATKALILDKLGSTSDALPAHEALLKRQPDNAAYWIAYGHSLRSAGRTDDAIAAYRRAIAIDPERGEAWWSLANIKSAILTDDDASAMEDALRTAVDVLNIAPLHFALGRALHDRARYEAAFQHYSAGARLRAQAIDYDPREVSDEVDEYARRFGADFFASTSAASDDGPVPIFLISLPRSGSTLLEQMLDAHPDIEALGELPYVRALVHSALELHIRRGPLRVPELFARLTPAERQAFGQDYLNRAAAHRRTSSRYFIDKMPMNWSDMLFIRQILPQARFIEIRRNSMDCCWSNFVHYFSLAHAASFDLEHMGLFCRDYVRFMDHIDSAAPGVVQHVTYEALVESPEAQVRPVLESLDLDWSPDSLRFHESGRSVRTPSAEQVRRPLNRSGIGTWKPYEQWLGPLKKALGPLAD